MDGGVKGVGEGKQGWRIVVGKMECRVWEEVRYTRDNETDRSDLSSVDRGGRRLGWSGVSR